MSLLKLESSYSATSDTVPLRLNLEPLQLRSLVEDVTRAVIKELGGNHFGLINGKLALTEEEAAGMLELNSWQLRDLRRNGKIDYHRIVGGRIRYTIEDLQKYLATTRRRGI